MVVPIFYNIFIPADPSGKQRALAIVQEQLDMMVQFTTGDKKVLLFYNTLSAAPPPETSTTSSGDEDETDGETEKEPAEDEEDEKETSTNLTRNNNSTNNNTTANNNSTKKPELDGTKPTLLLLDDAILVQQVVNATCRNHSSHWKCRHLAHYPKGGSESITLASLHQFCRRRPTNTAKRTTVTYLHNKGSFHDSDSQTYWRQALTAAALHPQCLQPPSSRILLQQQRQRQSHNKKKSRWQSWWSWWSPPPPTCNVCGLLFEPTWTHFYPGNMWTANCDYVRKLVSPHQEHYNANFNFNLNVVNLNASSVMSDDNHHDINDYESLLFSSSMDYRQRLHHLAELARREWIPDEHHDHSNNNMMMNNSSNNTNTTTVVDQLDWFFTAINFTNHIYPRRQYKNDFWGLGRYADEHWIGTHPDLAPCDVSRVNFGRWRKHFYQTMNFSWSMAPKRSLFHKPWPGYLLWVDIKLLAHVVDTPELRRNEYTFLAGSLFRWIGLYNQTPPYPSSWVWSFFPDPQYWHDQIPRIRDQLLPLLVRQAQQQQAELQKERQEHQQQQQLPSP
ncbi:hypothetical protein ACA910_005498 [Epithemia clementina (nom. ined.)]